MRAERPTGRLEKADHRKDVFLATLAHGLCNPLAPFPGALTLLKRGDLTGPRAEQAPRGP